MCAKFLYAWKNLPVNFLRKLLLRKVLGSCLWQHLSCTLVKSLKYSSCSCEGQAEQGFCSSVLYLLPGFGTIHIFCCSLAYSFFLEEFLLSILLVFYQSLSFSLYGDCSESFLHCNCTVPKYKTLVQNYVKLVFLYIRITWT